MTDPNPTTRKPPSPWRPEWDAEMLPNIVVTAEMVEAGVREMGEHRHGDDIRYILECVFRAMAYYRFDEAGQEGIMNANTPKTTGSINPPGPVTACPAGTKWCTCSTNAAPIQSTTGPKLTEDILAAVAPILAGQPSKLVLESMAAAMMAAATMICRQEHRGAFLDLYEASIAAFRRKVA